MKYIVTNFIYGTGPYLRTTEIALALNKELASRGEETFGVIVPLVYPGKQERIMLEEFAGEAHNIYLDAELGRILSSLFYGAEKDYQEALRAWVDKGQELSQEAHKHLRGKFSVKSLSGVDVEIDGRDIALEISRAPRLSYKVAPSYCVTFGYPGEILEAVLGEPESEIAVDRALVQSAIQVAREVEDVQTRVFLAEPSTFSSVASRVPRHQSEIATPPTIHVPETDTSKLEPGIYVTITGIPGLDRLYREAQELGLKIYSNDPKAVPGSEKLSPHAITNSAIRLQFARSGWGSVWLSQLVGTPLVVPDFDPKDDPEIYFNNKCVEALGLGVVYRGQPLEELLRLADAQRPRVLAYNKSLEERFGTLDGVAFVAKRIADHVLSK